MFDEPSVGAGTEELRDDLDAGIAAGAAPAARHAADGGGDDRRGLRGRRAHARPRRARRRRRGRPRDDGLRRRARAAAHALSGAQARERPRAARAWLIDCAAGALLLPPQPPRVELPRVLAQAPAGGARGRRGRPSPPRARPRRARRARSARPRGSRRRGAARAATWSCAASRARPRTASTSDLVPGIRASARRARCWRRSSRSPPRGSTSCAHAPPGLLGEAAALAARGRREEALWLVAQVAAISPRERWQASGPQRSRRRGAPGDDRSRRSRRRRCHGRRRGPGGRRRRCAARAACARPGARRSPPTAPGRRARGRAGGRPRRRALVEPGSGASTARSSVSRCRASRAARATSSCCSPGALGLAELGRHRCICWPTSATRCSPPPSASSASATRSCSRAAPASSPRPPRCRSARSTSALLNWARRADDPGAPRITGGSGAAPDADVRALVADALGLDDGWRRRGRGVAGGPGDTPGDEPG